jgi:15-hydroxyprostaglandin dehydrogenase (NAD)
MNRRSNFSRSLAYLTEESNIRVNAICPEIVDTPMALGLGEESLEELRTAGGILRPEDIAAGMVELIEDDSRFGAVMKSRFSAAGSTRRCKAV